MLDQAQHKRSYVFHIAFDQNGEVEAVQKLDTKNIGFTIFMAENKRTVHETSCKQWH